jgi:protein tyrosine phosphatase (PTP) superfamily phosphohydrolase (DUF442 family)
VKTETNKTPQLFQTSIAAMLLCLCLALPTWAKDYRGEDPPNFYWGPEPKRGELEELKAKGVKALINFRTNPRPEIGKAAQAMGFKYYHLRTGVFRKPSQAMVNRFLQLLENADNKPVYVFCKGGRDRTAFYVALYRMAYQGWSAKQAGQEVSSKVRFYWPTFRGYDEALLEYEKRITLSKTATNRSAAK